MVAQPARRRASMGRTRPAARAARRRAACEASVGSQVFGIMKNAAAALKRGADATPLETAGDAAGRSACTATAPASG